MTKPINWGAPSEDLDQAWHPSSLISLCCPHAERLGPYVHIKCTAKTDQTGRMPRLIWVFAGCTCHFVGFVMRWLIFTAFLSSLSAITASIFFKLSKVCHYQCWFYANFPFVYKFIQKWCHQNAWRTIRSSYLIWRVILHQKYLIMLEQLLYESKMLRNECVQNSFRKNLYKCSCLFATTDLLSVDVTGVLYEI